MVRRFSIEKANHAIFWVDPETELILNCNRAARNLLEKNKKEIIDLHQNALYPPQKAKYYSTMFKKQIEQNGTVDIEAEVITSSGRIKFIRITAGMTLVEGKPIIQGVFQDITERKRAEEELEVSEARYRRLFETAKDGILILNAATGEIDDVNPFLIDMLGYSREDFIGKKLWQIGPMKNVKECKKAFLELQRKKYVRYEDLPLEAKDGRSVEVEFISNVYKINHNKVIQCNIRDITERKRAERAIKDAREYAESIVSTIREPLIVLGNDLRVISANRSFYKMFKVTPEETNQQFIYELGDRQWDIPKLRELLEEILCKSIAFDDFAVEHEFPAIGRRTMLLNARKILGGTHRTEMILLAIEDITERRKMEKALRESKERFEYRSFHDGLTGLYNRYYFSEQMARLGKDLARSAPISIILIDIDGLKIVNDTLGHKVGDDLLISAAKIISECFRQVDIVARIGGDEFCIILPGVDRKAALAKKNRISKLVGEYNDDNPSIPLNMSVGVATFQDAQGETIYDIYQRADENMYEYKLIQVGSQKSKVIDILLSALAERDFVAQGHAERLSKMAEMMADRIHLSDDERKNLILLAKVHDMGKVGIPDKILFKPRKLSDKEFEKMKEHVQIGYNLASRSKELFHIANLILHHHEFWDGNGYNEGLKGEQIPLECRVFSIIDAYDAMTNTRPYRKGISKKRAIKELRRCSGTQFEQKLVDEFVEFVM
jgi:diguanylate cyclase (GGDEF)-like protein/PAS domain S-box-containing protein